MTALLGVLGLCVYAMACGPSIVDLGARGGALADAGAATSGAGGAASSGTAGMGQTGGARADSGAAAMSGAGSEPNAGKDAGAATPPDGAVPGTGPEPSLGCGTPPPASEDSITLNGETASYIVDPAKGYDSSRAYPLIISLRGANVDAAAFRGYLDLPGVVGADGIVVNLDCAGDAVTWDVQRDLPFFDALLAKLEASYCIDQRRVFVVGHATGAVFANSLACMRSGLLRGLGSLSGAPPSGACDAQLPVWIAQGSADPNVTPGRASRDFWVRQNQCDANSVSAVEPSPCLEYGGCEPGGAVRYCEYDGTLDLPSFAAGGVWSFLKGL